MDNTQVLSDKQLSCKVWAETIRNFIFIALAFFVMQPLLFVILTFLFGSRVIDNHTDSAMVIYLWKYTFYIYRIILIVSVMLLILFAMYIVLRKYAERGDIFVSGQSGARKSIIHSIKRYPELYLFGLTFIWITIAFLLSGDLSSQSGLGDDKGQGYIYYLCFVVIFVSFFATTKNQKAILLELFIASATIISLLADLIDGIGVMPRIYAFSFPETGIFSNRNYFGYFLAIALVLPVARMYKSKNIYLQVYYAACIVINELAMFITLTRGAFVGAFAGITFLLVFCPIQEKRFNIKLIIIPVILALALLAFELTGVTQVFGRIESMAGDASSEEAIDAMSSGRIAIWKGIIEQIKGSPIIGVGFGNTPNPHNEFLQTAAWHGMPAAIFYIAAIITMAVNAIKHIKELTDTQIAALCGAAGYIVSSFFGNGLLQTIPSYIIVLALCFNIELSLNNSDNKENKEEAGMQNLA